MGSLALPGIRAIPVVRSISFYLVDFAKVLRSSTPVMNALITFKTIAALVLIALAALGFCQRRKRLTRRRMGATPAETIRKDFSQGVVMVDCQPNPEKPSGGNNVAHASRLQDQRYPQAGGMSYSFEAHN